MGEGFVRIDFDCFSSRAYGLIQHLFSFIGLYNAEMSFQEIRFDLNGFLKAGEGIVQIPSRKMRQPLHVKLLWVFQSSLLPVIQNLGSLRSLSNTHFPILPG